MRSRACARPALLAMFVAAVLLAVPDPAQAGDLKTGRIDIEARLEPADLKPGQTGTLIVEATLLPKLHIYATGEQAMTYGPIEAKGVTYDKDTLEITKHHVWKDEMGEPYDVWEGTFTAKMNVTLADDVAPGTKVGMTFTYFGCTDKGCYAPIRDHQAFVEVGGAAKPAAPQIANPAPTAGGAVRLIVNEERGMVAVVFEPAAGYHFYGPGSTKGLPVDVVPQATEGVTWGEPVYPPVVGEDIHGPYSVTIKYERKDGANQLRLLAKYAACTDQNCLPPEEAELTASWANTAAAAAAGGPAGKAPPVNPNVVADAGPQIENAPLAEGGSVEIKINEERGLVAVIFTPEDGHHFYGPQYPDDKVRRVEVVPVESKGIKWGTFELPDAKEIKEPYTVVIPFERADGANELAVIAKYLACTDAGICKHPHTRKLTVTWGGAAAPPKEPDPVPEAPKGDLLFPVVDDDDLSAVGEDTENLLSGNLFLAFGAIFLLGMGLAFTPCVLPIIPITVSVISGGKADIPKRRLAGLLLTYVSGLALTFATLGVIAALAGGSMSAAFENPGVQWGIAILFFILAFMMLGIYELQPPAWLMKLQGGAQKRSGSFVGAFLFGCLGAIIASPCTGPFIAGLLIETAKSGSAVLGFFSFLMLGLGMGAVFFAVGSLNFALRPGPWMVWVRYSFAAMLVGVALYYLSSGGLISWETVFIIGFAVAVLAWIGVSWHLQKKEGEQARPARIRGAQVAVMLLAVVGFVGYLTRPPDNLLEWIKVKDIKHLVALVDEAKTEGKPVVIDFWATWCHYCKEYDKLIAGDKDLREKFEQVVRIKVDVTKGKRKLIRDAVGMPDGQPLMVIIDKHGRIRRNADVRRWFGYDKGVKELATRLDLVLNDTPVKTAANAAPQPE